MSRNAVQLVLETLLVEALCVTVAAAIYLPGLDDIGGSGWTFFIIMLSGAGPAPVYLGMRSRNLLPRLSVIRFMAVSVTTGLLVVTAIIGAAWTRDYFVGCPDNGCGLLGRHPATTLAAIYGILIVLPAFVIVPPVLGFVRERSPRANRGQTYRLNTRETKW